MFKKFLLVAFLVKLSFISFSQTISDTSTLRTRINTQIVPNSTQAITATKLNQILNGYLNSMPKLWQDSTWRDGDTIRIRRGFTNQFAIYAPITGSSGGNIYNINGILTGNRTITGKNNTYNIAFDSLNSFRIQRNGITRFNMTSSITQMISPNQSGDIGTNNGNSWLIFIGNAIRNLGDSTTSTKLISYESNINGSLTPNALTSKSYVDSLVGAIVPGGSGSDNTNVGSGYRLLKPATQQIKTLFNGYGSLLDSSSNTDGLTIKIDTFNLATRLRVQKAVDSLGVVISGISGGGTSNTNTGSGFRWLKPSGQEIKTKFDGIGLITDSTSNTNGLTTKVDSFTIATRLRVQKAIDSLGVVIGGTGIDSTYVDTTFFKRIIADQKRGNVLGTLYSETGFGVSSIDTFSLAGGTNPLISNSKLLLKDATGSGSVARLKRYTALDRLTLKAGFIIGQKDGVSYGFQIGIKSVNTTFELSISGYLEHRTTGGFDGVLSLNEWNGVSGTRVAQAASNVILSQGDSIEIIFDRNVNVFTITARNVTTGTAEVSTSYTYNGLTTAVNTGVPELVAVGKDSVYHFSFYSNESTNADLITIGDSKFSWYGNNIGQAIPSLLYSKYGNVINQGKSGDKTAEVILTIPETIALNPRQAIVTIGSNDIRNGISSGTWQANIDTIYKRYTRAGIEVYFDLMYETAISQTALVTYLSTNYPTRWIGSGYTATQNCKSCLLADNIHQTAFGNRTWVEAVARSGMMDFFNVFREMKFIAGDLGVIEVGDSLIKNRYFRTTNKINVFREGELQWEASTYQPNSVTRTNDSLYFHPPLATGERIIIQSYSHVNWTTLTPEPAPFSFLFDTYANSDKGLSIRKLSSSYSGYCMKIRRSSDNAEQDIGFVNNEIDTAAMKIFAGASSAFVSVWYDQSTNGAPLLSKAATQATAGFQPRIMNSGVIDRVQNNLGNWIVAIKFDGSDDFFDVGDLTQHNVDWSSFMVQKRSAAGNTGGVYGTGASQPASPYQHTDNNMYLRRTETTLGSVQYSAADATATYCLLNGFSAATVMTAYKNGSAYSLGSATTGTAFGTVFNRIGYTGGSYTNGYISEVIMYMNDKTANRVSIQTQINNFFDLF